MGQQIFQACNSLLTSIFNYFPALNSYEMNILCVCVCLCCVSLCVYSKLTNFHETRYESCNTERSCNNVFSNFLQSVENNMVDAGFCEVSH